jgi:O-antigen/teichoic acid export membrane protein
VIEPSDQAPSTPRMGLVGRMAVNSMVQIGGNALGALLGFFVFIAVARTLGPAAYGDFATATAFLAVPVVLADVGLSPAVVREISSHPDRTERVVGASLPLRVVLSLAFVGLAVAASFLLPFNERTRIAILIGSLGALFTLMWFSVLPVLQARLKLHWSAAGTVVGRAAALALTLGFLAAGLGLNAVMTATVVGLGLMFVITAFGAARVVRLRPRIDLLYVRRLVRESLLMGAALGLAQLIFRVDLIVLALLKTSEEVGWYGAAYKFTEYAGLVANGITLSLFPVFARFAASDQGQFAPFLQKSLEVMLALAAPIAVVGVLLAPEIIDLTAGHDFENGAVALGVLAPSLLAGFVALSYWSALISTGQERALLGIVCGLLLLNVAANFAAIASFGYKGAAAVVLVTAFVELAALAYLAGRRLGFVPDARYAVVIAAGAAAMVLTIELLPGPAVLRGIWALVLYASLLFALPGTVRELGARVVADLRADR